MSKPARGSKKSRSSSQPLFLPIILNLLFAIIEIIGSLFTNSLMLATDALHDLGNSLALLITAGLQRRARRQEGRQFSYGLYRLNLLAAFINAMILLLVAALVLPTTLQRLLNPSTISSLPVVYLAILGAFVHTLFLIFSPRRRASRVNPSQKKIAFFEIAEDLVCWLIVLIASLAIYLFDVPILDPLISLIMIIFMLVMAIRDFYRVLVVFLQAVPANLDLKTLSAKIEAQPHVQQVVDFHIWTLDEQKNVATVVVAIDKDLTWRQRANIKDNIKTALRGNKIESLTIQLDEIRLG